MFPITGKTRIAAVIGHPITHSLSPLLHNHWLQKLNIDGVYIPLNIAPDDLANCIIALFQAGLRGMNITLPHKIAAMSLCDTLTKRARLSGAVNTLWKCPDTGHIHGDNSDGYGFIASLSYKYPDFQWQGAKTLLLGTGGSTRGLAVAMAEAGCQEIRLAGRNPEKVNLFCQDLQSALPECQIIGTKNWPVTADCVQDCDLIINTTSAELLGDALPTLPISCLAKNSIIADIIYTPLQTEFLKQAANANLRTINGLGMLIWQASVGFKYWFDQTAPIDDASYTLLHTQLS